jgi:hypothetical protein
MKKISVETRSVKCAFFSLFFLSLLSFLWPLFFQPDEVHGAQLSLVWDASPDAEVTGYRLHYGRASGIYNNFNDAGNSLRYTVTGLDAGVTYFFACTAYTSAGAESAYSNELSYTMPGDSSVPLPPPSGGSDGGGGGCFIATAAWGSRLAPEVVTLREFRDRYLITNAAGQAFVEWYYRVSPPAAAFIAEHEALRTAARWGLTPIVFSIKHPISLLVAFGIAGLILVGRRSRR